MKILVTGAAGFIGYHLSRRLMEMGFEVVGLDNMNDYYDVGLKLARLGHLKRTDRFKFMQTGIENREQVERLFQAHKFDVVVNLAAQAGVRYSLENPHAYVDSNLVGFVNILEACRHHGVGHLVYASSSSVYGANKKLPFAVEDNVDHPISLYAATKKANELMAHTYSHLYGFATTGLRFFTVYGPWGRPDMAPFLFTRAIMAGEPIKVFNHGNMKRDFTYIDDIIEGVVRVIQRGGDPERLYRVYNIGNNKSVNLEYFISVIEDKLGKKADKEYLPMQPGDVQETYADIGELTRDTGFQPITAIEDGMGKFIDWYVAYYGREQD